MLRYLRFRCPNRPTDSSTECRHTLGGPAVEVLRTHNWVNPFVDIRYCKDCKAFYKITIRGFGSIPKIVMIDRDKQIPWVEADKFFPLVTLCGNRIIKG
jgi:hypothetical protein